jgi:putative LPXTG-motif protein cell wall anchor domain protein
MKKINSIIKAGILALLLPVVIPAGMKVASLSIESSIIANAATSSSATLSSATPSSSRSRGSSRQGASGVRTYTGNKAINRINIGAWMQDDKGWWYRSYDGTYPKFRWMELAYDGQTDWYYFDEQGYMLTGWRNINEKWYYLFEKTGGRAVKGAAAKGWVQIDDKWYYFYEKTEGDSIEGSRAQNTTIGGYKLDAHGVWIK